MTSTDILCIENAKIPSFPLETEIASMGDLYVDWRLHNDKILSPPDLSPWQPLQKEKKSIVNSQTKNNDSTKTGENGNGFDFGDFEWLLQWGSWSPIKTNLIENNKQAVDQLNSTTRVCGMVFSVPKVKISPSPFDVIIELPTACNINDIIPLAIIIKNKLLTAEHLNFSIKNLINSSSSTNNKNINSGPENINNAPQKLEISSDSSISSSSSGFVVVGNASSLLDVRS